MLLQILLLTNNKRPVFRHCMVFSIPTFFSNVPKSSSCTASALTPPLLIVFCFGRSSISSASSSIVAAVKASMLAVRTLRVSVFLSGISITSFTSLTDRAVVLFN